MRWLALAALVLLACKPKPPPLPPSLQVGDLRQALLAMVPEYRGIALLPGRVAVSRHYAGEGPELTGLCAGLTANGFHCEASAGRLTATRGEVTVDGTRTAGGAALTATAALAAESLPKVMGAPTAMTSDQLSAHLPPYAAALDEEVFQVLAGYQATPERADALLRQLAGIHGQSGWAVSDAGPAPEGEVGELLEYQLADPTNGARLSLGRLGGRVTLDYRLTTRRR
ncbi:MAG: hypothetical protein K1X89_17940 [Myxococcaceae bacterium]|nr:hypothetical protein [Myxococcaceae bacterium]